MIFHFCDLESDEESSKTTLLELLDASPRLQKRLASMSLSSGKPIFHIDATDQEAVDSASEQMLPSIFFIKNLLACDPEHIKQLKNSGQVISFVKIDQSVQKFFNKTPFTEILEGVDCCLMFSDIAPLVNRLILGSLSQAMANISFSAKPEDFLYWGSWNNHWQLSEERPFAKHMNDICKELKLGFAQEQSLRELEKFGVEGILRKRNILDAEEMWTGCDGTLLIATVRYKVCNANAKNKLKIQRKVMKFEQDYLAVDISELESGYFSVTKFISMHTAKTIKHHKLLIVLNGSESINEVLTIEEKKAG